MQKLLNDDAHQESEKDEEEKNHHKASLEAKRSNGDPIFTKLSKMQEVYENTVMFDSCQKSIDYDDTLITVIITALQRVDLTGDMS